MKKHCILISLSILLLSTTFVQSSDLLDSTTFENLVIDTNLFVGKTNGYASVNLNGAARSGSFGRISRFASYSSYGFSFGFLLLCSVLAVLQN